MTVTGTLDVTDAFVFNESGADVDFRIESNNEANMFFVDGGTDKVGIGTNSPDSISQLELSQSGRACAS